ncbi:kinase-like domain-containing protein [Baffinella frigidus]|nr:kinase-like domain-containing protein [Cryptophyta sp. CCMP2293]
MYLIVTELCIRTLSEEIKDLDSPLHCATQGGEEKRRICLGVASAVAYLHSLEPNVLHRDIKNENIMLTADRTPKLIDFGLSKEQTDDPSAQGTSLGGTMDWMPPELAHGAQASAAGDIYSLGLVIWAVCMLLEPGQGPRENAAKVRMLEEEEPRWAAWLVRRCTESEATARLSAVQVIAILSTDSAPPKDGDLVAAVRGAKVETVQALLRVGATVDDVLSLNRDGKEDLEAREELERLERAIRECGVVDVVNDPAFPRGWENVLGDEACTALEEAKSSGNEQVARVMQEAIQDFKGMTQGWSPFGVRGVFVVQEAALENSVNYEDENALLAAVCAAGTCNFPGLKHKYEDIVNMLVEAASAADLSAGKSPVYHRIKNFAGAQRLV